MQALQVHEDSHEYSQPATFKENARDWGKLFLKLFHEDDITPYIHGNEGKGKVSVVSQYAFLSPEHQGWRPLDQDLWLAPTLP